MYDVSKAYDNFCERLWDEMNKEEEEVKDDDNHDGDHFDCDDYYAYYSKQKGGI